MTLMAERPKHMIEYKACIRCGGDLSMRGEYPVCVQCGAEDYGRFLGKQVVSSAMLKAAKRVRAQAHALIEERITAEALRLIKAKEQTRLKMQEADERPVADCDCGQECVFPAMTMCGACFWSLTAAERAAMVDGSPSEFVSGKWFRGDR